MTEPKLSISILERNDPAFALVKSAWRISYWEGNYLPDMEFNAFLVGHNELMLRLIARSQVRVVKFEDVDEVLGFAVVEESILSPSLTAHYVYVKAAFRRQHLAQALLTGVNVYSMITKKGLLLAKELKMQFNPYRIL